MRKFLILSCIPLLLASSCTMNKSSAKKSHLSGGVLKINENDNYVSLFPPSVRDIVSTQIVSQIHLGLVKYDVKSLVIEAGIASDWDVDNTGTVYTFHLDTKARFSNDPCFPGGEGRRITAEDFKYTFTLLCTQSPENKNFFGTVDKIVGTKQYYKASAEKATLPDISGIKVVNDSTLQLVIDSPYDLFIYYMANPAASVLPREAVEKYGSKMVVGAGPFSLDKLPAAGETIRLSRNENFFMRDEEMNQLPYLDSVKFTFVYSPKTEIKMFFDGELDLVMNLRNEYVNEILDKHINEFEMNPPLYVLSRNERLTNNGDFVLLKSSVNNFYTNKMETIDLTRVYLKRSMNTK